MGTATVIVIGLVAISIIAVIGDVISKTTQARLKFKEGSGGAAPGEIGRLQDRLARLESRVEERDESIRKLQDEVRFVSRMLEDRSGGQSGN